MRRNRVSLAANPVLVGAVTVLVVIVAVFLAYNANAGLPFVPTYSVQAVVPDAAELVEGNDVRVGGTRVGQVEKIAAALSAGKPVAVLGMKLEQSLEPLPRDTRLIIRQRSNVGLKYVELRLGRDRRGIPQGGTLPLDNALASVDLDDVTGMFDRPTRRGFGEVISEFGVGVAGRGGEINRAFEALPALTRDLAVVGRTLAAPRTELRGFIDGAAAAASAVAPVAEPLRAFFDSGATTFGALERERRALGATIDKAPATEKSTTEAFVALRPLLREATALVRDAGPGVRLLPRASRRLAAGLEASGPALGRARAIAAPLERLVAQTRMLARNPSTTGALQRLTDIVRTTTPFLTFLNPFQTKCNALGLWTRNVPSLASEGDALGTWFRFIFVNNLPELLPHDYRTADLHYTPLPDGGQNGECESGNETWVPGQQIGAVPGRQPLATEPTPPGTLYEKVLAEEPRR